MTFPAWIRRRGLRVGSIVAVVLAVAGILVVVAARPKPARVSVVFGPMVVETNGVKWGSMVVTTHDVPALRMKVTNVSETGHAAQLYSRSAVERPDGSLDYLLGPMGFAGAADFSLGPGETRELVVPEPKPDARWRVIVSQEKETPFFGPLTRLIPMAKGIVGRFATWSEIHVVTNSPTINNGAFVDVATPRDTDP